MHTKTCHVCKGTYEVASRTGLKEGRCRECRKAYNCEAAKKRYAEGKAPCQKRPSVYREQWRKYRESHKKELLCYKAKRRAENKGIAFDLKPEDFEIPNVCPVLGLALSSEGTGGMQSPNCPTLDRIDPAKGYIRGNVWVISWRANKLKSDASLDELRLLLAAVERKVA